MSKNKDLKRVIRSRMAKTGESYSIARRYVTERSSSDVVTDAPTPKSSTVKVSMKAEKTMSANRLAVGFEGTAAGLFAVDDGPTRPFAVRFRKSQIPRAVKAKTDKGFKQIAVSLDLLDPAPAGISPDDFIYFLEFVVWNSGVVVDNSLRGMFKEIKGTSDTPFLDWYFFDVPGGTAVPTQGARAGKLPAQSYRANTKEPSGDSRCPCGSTRLAGVCCLRDGKWRPRRATCAFSGEQTMLERQSCYAASLKNCSKKMSREHGVSKSALEELGGKFEASGFPWMSPGEKKVVTAASLTSRVLCERHNGALSPFDDQGKRLAEILRRIDRDLLSDDPNTDEFFLFNGHDIERWILKALCWQLSSGNASIGDERIVWTPEPEWNRIIFSDGQFGAAGGLYFGVDSEPIHAESSVGMVPLTTRTATGTPVVTGCTLQLGGFSFILAMVGKLKEVTGTRHYRELVRRPSQLVFSNGQRTKVIQFGWDEECSGAIIPIELSGRDRGARPPAT